jgi:hypothetical protein
MLVQQSQRTVQVIRVPFTLASLQKPLKERDREELEVICREDLGPQQDPQCISAKFIDKDGKPILFYFGCRVIEKGQIKPVFIWSVFWNGSDFFV